MEIFLLMLDKMFFSAQTHEGLKIAVYSHIEVVKFLLSVGFQYVLTERFMQDVLQDYFGHQREVEDQTTHLLINLDTMT